MPTSAITSAGLTPNAAENSATMNDSFRDADFMKILLSEITQQDPFKPQDTQQIVDSMQKMQMLANTRYEKTRDDQRWARDLVGGSVTVQQAQLGEQELKSLRERGLDPDIGYQSTTGVVESFRIVGEETWLRIGGKDYKIDDVRQIVPPETDGSTLAGMSDMLARYVTWAADGDSPAGEGVVSSTELGEDGQVLMGINGSRVALNRVRGIYAVKQ